MKNNFKHTKKGVNYIECDIILRRKVYNIKKSIKKKPFKEINWITKIMLFWTL